MKVRSRSSLPALATALAVVGALAIGHGLYIPAKARVAQMLIDLAFERNRVHATNHAPAGARPWAWADTTPLARLHLPRQQTSMVVLAGDSGRVLAFGPGHRADSAAPGARGNSVISAHRDTHFRVLGRVAVGDPLRIERSDGASVDYLVSAIRVVDAADLSVIESSDVPTLTLVTCWPVDAIDPSGRERLVVSARARSIMLSEVQRMH